MIVIAMEVLFETTLKRKYFSMSHNTNPKEKQVKVNINSIER